MLDRSERTVKEEAEHLIRMEVVRTEIKKTRSQPLQPYMNAQ